MEYKHGIHEIKYQYGLHDTEINGIVCTNDGIIFEFDGGVYLLDDTGRETTLSKKCYLKIIINDFNREKMYEHISITLFNNKKIKEIEFDKFEALLSKDVFSVYLDYYCPFADSLLIKGDIDNYGVEFEITEIAEISYTFDS